MCICIHICVNIYRAWCLHARVCATAAHVKDGLLYSSAWSNIDRAFGFCQEAAAWFAIRRCAHCILSTVKTQSGKRFSPLQHSKLEVVRWSAPSSNKTREGSADAERWKRTQSSDFQSGSECGALVLKLNRLKETGLEESCGGGGGLPMCVTDIHRHVCCLVSYPPTHPSCASPALRSAGEWKQ